MHPFSQRPRRFIVLSPGDEPPRVGAALDDAREAGLTDPELLEVVASVALTVYTNYLNLVAETEIDFPPVRHHDR